MPDEQFADIKIAALMSVPTVGWNHHWGFTNMALYTLGIPLRLAFGVFWHNSFSNLLQDCVDEGLDWILTLDFDSIITADHISRLLTTFGSNPHIDALAALQCKRGTEQVPLMSNGKTQVEINGDPLKVNTAHFGLTLLRIDALKKVPMPWFQSMPDKDGSYRSLGRVDPDIFFWHQWQKAGNSLYVDPMCSIGHLQPMVTCYDDRFQVQHLHVPQWREQHRPGTVEVMR